jgi:hypothetical protein
MKQPILKKNSEIFEMKNRSKVIGNLYKWSQKGLLGILLCGCMLIVPGLVSAQPNKDIKLFTIQLNDDSMSIYGCIWNDQVQTTLSGPVHMADKTLLFYSQNGYVLYDRKGKLLDSHSLFRTNRKGKYKKNPLCLAYPLDSVTLLYYQEGKDKLEVYRKQLHKNGMKKVDLEKRECLKDIKKVHLFNLAHNTSTDEMARKCYEKPHLVGYTSEEGGYKWWTTDKFYSFDSPLILEKEGTFVSFFPGVKASQKTQGRKHLIEPLGAFTVGGRWFYYGLSTSGGNTSITYYQSLSLADQGGNILYTINLLKEEITDAVLQKNRTSNTIFTVRRASRHVFVPAIDNNGDVYYGIIDFERKSIDIHKKEIYHFKPHPYKSVLKKEFEAENQITFTPMYFSCNPESEGGLLPEFITVTDTGIATLKNDDVMFGQYYVKIHRHNDDMLKKKLRRVHHSLNERVQKIQDSIAKVETSWCPYAISIMSKESGPMTSFHYGIGDELLSARVLGRTAGSELVVRVDLEKWAEVVVFYENGDFCDRFVFNNQDFTDRKDLLVVSEKHGLIEKDLENGEPEYKHWKLEKVGVK